MVQSIWFHLSRIPSYDVPNKGINQFAFLDTSKTLQIAFWITFKNWSYRFLISSKLKHNKSLISRIQFKKNYLILVNCVKVITSQTWPPRIMDNLHQHDNNKQPTLRDSKPSPNMSKWLEIWNIVSLIGIIHNPKVVSCEMLLGTRYSHAN